MMQLFSRKELAFLDDLASLLEMYQAVIVSRDECEVGIIIQREENYNSQRNSIRVQGGLSAINLRVLISENKYELRYAQKEYEVGCPIPSV